MLQLLCALITNWQYFTTCLYRGLADECGILLTKHVIVDEDESSELSLDVIFFGILLGLNFFLLELVA